MQTITEKPPAAASQSPAHEVEVEVEETMSGISAAEFSSAFRHYPGGVAVVTAQSPLGPVALTVTSVVSVSAEPPLLAFSIGHRASTAPGIRAAESYVIHFLGSEQLDLAQLCATSGVDRFADRGLWARLPTGEPYFPSAPARIVGKRIDQLDTESASLILVLAQDAHITPEADFAPPLVHHNRAWHRLGEHSHLN
ncbi:MULTISPECIES: flavin reductase family protein [unclassified Salinibacterium]|uniref:flavin reductase family protein n=1 Tax=unclassified Salinibacterium TaxID=2632331 RepID=UPI001E33EDBC|nr:MULTISPECIES: flavin reductase family protein [unclassified Salinibacterium]